MTKIIPFKKEHLECMDLRNHEKSIIHLLNDDILKNAIAVTGITDGRVVCSGGINVLAGGNADIWLIPSIYVKDYKLIFVKELRKWLFGLAKDLALTRMQTVCLNDEFHENWMRFLGFEKEGVMKSFMNGEDYAMYGRVFTWE